MISVPESELDPGIAVEGAADHFFGRPLDANPYNRLAAPEWWTAWRFGWLEASTFRQTREAHETARWRRAA
jgi:hypothetical protein